MNPSKAWNFKLEAASFLPSKTYTGSVTFISLMFLCSNWCLGEIFPCLFHAHRSYMSTRTTDAQWSLFSLKSRTFGFGQTNWANEFWGIWGTFGRTISTHFGAVSPLSMFSIIQPLFLQKTKPLYTHPKYLFGIGIWIWAAKN